MQVCRQDIATANQKPLLQLQLLGCKTYTNIVLLLRNYCPHMHALYIHAYILNRKEEKKRSDHNPIDGYRDPMAVCRFQGYYRPAMSQTLKMAL